MGVCDVCGRPADELARSYAADRLNVCEACHCDAAPAVDDPVAIGRQLGIKRCDECREPLGGRYDGLCWPCFDRRHPEPVRRRRSSRPDWVQFRLDVWDGLAKHGTVFYLDGSHIAATCPRCLHPVDVRFLDGRPPLARFDCHGAGCTAQEILSLIGGGA